MIPHTPEQAAAFRSNCHRGLLFVGQPSREEVEARIHQAILREWTESQGGRAKPVVKPYVAPQLKPVIKPTEPKNEDDYY